MLRRFMKLNRLLMNAQYRRGLWLGVGAAIEHEGIVRSLSIGTFIDVGANVGQFSLLVHSLHPKANIYAFEPMPLAANRYARLFKDHLNVKLFRLGAAESNGTAQMHVSEKPDSSSILPITQLQVAVFPGTAEVSMQSIEIDRIDAVLDGVEMAGPVFVKLDVQGFELSALRGMAGIMRHLHYVYAEVSFREFYEGQPLAHEVVAWLSGCGFIVSGVCNSVMADDGSCVQADFLFVNNSRLVTS